MWTREPNSSEGDGDGESIPSTSPLSLCSPESHEAVLYSIHHVLPQPLFRISIAWARGNSIRLSLIRKPHLEPEPDGNVGGQVIEVRLGCSEECEISEVEWRRITYGSVMPFALLQNRKNTVSSFSKMQLRPHHVEWWEFVMEYSKEISLVLANSKRRGASVFEDSLYCLKDGMQPTCLKAAWELMEIFYADKQSQAWLPERLVDWLADHDCLFSAAMETVHSKLAKFQRHLVTLQVIEDDPKYWEVISSALAVGWLEIVVKMLRLHGSYQLDQLGHRETENGLVEAVAVLISKMPRMRPETGKLGECFKEKPDFIKAWEKWRSQIIKLESSAFWFQCDHGLTREGLKNMLQIMLGNGSLICNATCHWIEFYVAHFLYIRPFTAGLESFFSLSQKCFQSKPPSNTHVLMRLLVGILGENAEVVLAECSRGFGTWMMSHAVEFLTAGSEQAELVLNEEHDHIGGISINELHRLIYAQVLSSHNLTWQIAPIYLASCVKQGMGLLEILLRKMPVQHNRLLLKSLEICRLYELETASSSIKKIAGVHHWKHGRRGPAIFWLQQAHDEVRLSEIAQKLFNSIGTSISGESFMQWDGLLELLGLESTTGGGLEFLHRYRDFKKCLQNIADHDGASQGAAQKAAESLTSLMQSSSTPQRFWLPLLHDSLKLLNCQGHHHHPHLNVSQTSVLLNKLQEQSMARLRPAPVEPELPPAGTINSISLLLPVAQAAQDGVGFIAAPIQHGLMQRKRVPVAAGHGRLQLGYERFRIGFEEGKNIVNWLG